MLNSKPNFILFWNRCKQVRKCQQTWGQQTDTHGSAELIMTSVMVLVDEGTATSYMHMYA